MKRIQPVTVVVIVLALVAVAWGSDDVLRGQAGTDICNDGTGIDMCRLMLS